MQPSPQLATFTVALPAFNEATTFLSLLLKASIDSDSLVPLFLPLVDP